MDLTAKQRRYLKSLAHHLNPLVQVGKQGYTPELRTEISRNLADHELIKVRLMADDKAEFQALAEQIAADTASSLVATIGRIALLYRRGEEPAIRLP